MAFKNGWAQHPAVRTGVELAIGERAADVMKRTLATWTCLLGFGALIASWIATNGFGVDKAPYIGLNLVLSGIAGLQCFVLLIAAKRGDQINAELAQHSHETGEKDFLVDQEALHLLRAIAKQQGITLEGEAA